MSALARYLPLNPFVDLSVGEAELWGSRAWLDVPQIHSAQFNQLKQAVDLVRANRRTQVRFVRGVGGSGKSHLFARLRREMGESLFYAYVSNPPMQADALEAFLLGRIVGSLRQKARTIEGTEAPYSQLRLLAYALLRPAVEQSVSIEDLHAAWMEIPQPEQKDLLHEAMLLLEASHPMVPRAVMRCLLNVLRDDKENLASQWLSGTTSLTEADLKFLGEPDSMGRELHGTVIHLLGKLSAMAQRPFILVLDQLDLVTTTQQLDEFQRLLFALIDQSENWVVLIGLVGDRFRFWEDNINQALRGRVGVPSTDGAEDFRLPVIEVTPIVTADKEVLIRTRLASPALERQRALDGEKSPLFPLRDAELAKLTAGGAVYARHLLAASADRFTQSVMSPDLNNRVSLAEKMDALLEESADASRAECAYLSAVELGERVRELVELLAEPPATLSDGPMRTALRSFDGTDHVFDGPKGQVRIVSSDATRRPFISVLERLQEEKGRTLLLRNGAAGLSGQVTMDLFNKFKEYNFFHQVSQAESAVLLGLGKVLASLREKNYEQLLTDPAPAFDNVMQVLRESGRLRSLRLWTAVEAAMEGKPQPVVANPEPAAETMAPREASAEKPLVEKVLAEKPSVIDPASLAIPPPPMLALSPVAALTARLPAMPQRSQAEKLPQHALETAGVLLKTERWMEVRRLQRRLGELGCECSLESLRLSLRTTPLAEHAMLHPLDPADDGTGPQIVLWNDSVH